MQEEIEEIGGILLTFCGVCLSSVSTNPSCPFTLFPQVKIFPCLSRNIEKYSYPPATATMSETLVFFCGELICVVWPSPNSPFLFPPQTQTFPSSSTNIDQYTPPAIDLIAGSPSIFSALFLCDVSPNPKFPCVLYPQLHIDPSQSRNSAW